MPEELKRGPGRPRKVEEVVSSHIIYPDGSYSNTPTVEVVPEPPKIWQIFRTKSGSQYQIIHMDFGGVYVFGYPYHRQPRVQDCDFWELDKFFSERADV